MAPVGESSYLPPLDQCLNGEKNLLSWTRAYEILSQPSIAIQSAKLRDFLRNDDSIDILRRWLDPFEPTGDAARQQARVDYTTRTSPASFSYPEADTVKSDVDWLVKKTKIDELSALRIAVLEIVARSATLLQQDAVEGGSLAVRDTMAQSVRFDASLGSTARNGPDENATGNTWFTSEQARHSRLLKLYLIERLHVVRIGGLLRRLNVKEEGYMLGDETAPGWLIDISQSIDSQAGKNSPEMWTKFRSLIEASQNRVERLQAGSQWSGAEEPGVDVEEDWTWTQLAELTALFLSLASFLDSSQTLPSSQTILAWYHFAGSVAFFKDLVVADQSQSAAVALLQALTAIISLNLLRLRTLDDLEAAVHKGSTSTFRQLEGSYLYDPGCIGELQRTFLDVVTYGPSPAAPALLGWSAFALAIGELAVISGAQRRESLTYPDTSESRNRRSSLTADPENAIERAEEVIRSSLTDADPIAILAAGAVDNCHAQEIAATLSSVLDSTLSNSVDRAIQINARRLLLFLLDRTSQFTGYSSSLVASTIDIVGGVQRSWCGTRMDRAAGLSEAFAHPDLLASRLESEATGRYPFEIIPFLRFAKLSCQLGKREDDGQLQTTKQLQTMGSFTQVMPAHFQSYDLPREDEDPNIVRLQENLVLFRPHRNATIIKAPSALVKVGSDTAMVIPSRTEGTVINNGRPLVTSWNHSHSAWQYLANWLVTAISGCEWVEAANAAPLSLDVASEILGLFASWLHTSLSLLEDTDGPQAAFTDISDFLSQVRDEFRPDRDLVNIVLELFEQRLQSHCLDHSVDGSLDTLINSTQFLAGVAKVFPGRVWAFLSTSSLLELGGSGGALIDVVEASEMTTGRYDFYIASIQLYETLIDDAVRNVLMRQSSKSSRRFGDDYSQDVTPDRTMSAVLFAFTQSLTSLFASSGDWRFLSSDDKSEINIRLLGAFERTLRYTYAFDGSSSTNAKLVTVLDEASKHLLNIFLSTSGSEVSCRSVLQILFDSAFAPQARLSTREWTTAVQQSEVALRFLNSLIRVSTLLNTAHSALEAKLFRLTPLMARLFCSVPPVRSQTLQLLEAMVRSAARSEKEPPSLLGHMGADAAKAFLSVLSTVSRSSENVSVRVAVWDLLCAVVSCKQQWFAIYALTGTTAKESLKSKGKEKSEGSTNTLLQTALEGVSEPGAPPPEISAAMLRFVLLSSNYWPRVLRDIRKHARFLDGIISYLGALKRNPRERDSERLVQSCYETRMAGLIAEILAMNIHFAKQLGGFEIAEKASSKLAYFKEFGVAPPRYNTSLHTNLERNLEAKYPGCRLHNFRKTELLPSKFGEDFFYDLSFATKVLDFDPSWSNEQSLRRELPLANLDLSLVEAQIELLNSWKLLAVELSSVCNHVKRVQPLLISVVQKCLDANANSENPPLVYERLVQLRADFAFALLHRLLQSSLPLSELRPILSHVWDAIRTSSVDFEAAFTSSGTTYYRSLLKILYLALKPHAETSKQTTSATNGDKAAPQQTLSKQVSPAIPTLFEILEHVVALGFRSLAGAVHESASAIDPNDFILITALLQSILQVHGISSVSSQLVLIFTSTNVVRYATSLFSWADQLALPVDGSPDPVYGELSILFLLELSAIPPVAETMAVEGILSQLSTAQICQYFLRESGMGPFDTPGRLFSIWSKGFLPLCLNLLGAVGAPLAAEIAAFLNQFAPQMARNAAVLESRPSSVRGAGPFAGSITLGIAKETHHLALIAFALDRAREAGASEGVVASDIPPLEWDRASVKEDLQVWLGGKRGLAERIVATSETEEALLRSAPVAKRGKGDNALEEKIVLEFEGALLCLGAEDGHGIGS